MEKKAVGVIGFVGGLVVGGVLGALATIKVTKKKYMAELDRRVAEMEAYYQKPDRYDRSKRRVKSEEAYDTSSRSSNTGRENGRTKCKAVSDICKHTDCKEEERTDYSKKFEKGQKGDSKAKEVGNYVVQDGSLQEASDEELLAENEYPEEDDDDISEAEEAMFESAQKDRGRLPRIISFEKMGELDASYDNQVLFYYMYNDTLADEDGNVIDEPHLLLGDCLEKYGFMENEEQLIFVQNFALRTIYEVEKVWKAFNYD